MGIQTMGSQINGHQFHLQPPSPLARQNSWYSLTLDEVENQLGNLGKPLGSMNLDEILKNVWSTDANQSPASSLQRQASLSFARALSGKTVEEVWREIQQGQRKRYGKEIKIEQREQTFREMTLEDFLVQAGLFLDTVKTPQNFQQEMVVSSPLSSVGALSDTTILERKRDSSDALEKTIERRLKRKIKNRESAARSRARKQAYHNELVSKVTHLEEENIKLKKEKELEKILPWELSPEPKYQLRRTSSALF